MTVRKTTVRRDVKRERLNLLQVLVEERLEYVDLVGLSPKSQESGIPLILELGQGAVAVKVDRTQVADIGRSRCTRSPPCTNRRSYEESCDIGESDLSQLQPWVGS